MGREAALAGAALAAQYNFNDLALEMVHKSGDTALLRQMRQALGVAFVGTAKSHFPADNFQSGYIERSDAGWRTDFSVTDTCIVYGPYIRLPQGEYEAVFHVATTGLTEKALHSRIEVDVAAAMSTVNSLDLTGAAGADLLRSGKITLPFYNGQPNALFEFRLSTFGRPFNGTMLFTGVTLRSVSKG
jgi:hypothetical protein